MTTAWPGDSATVIKWVRSALKQMSTDGEVSVSGLERVKVSADLTGTDLQHLTLDATGVKLRVRPGDSAGDRTPAAAPEPEPPEPALSKTGIAKNFRFIARPMRIQRTPVTVDVRADDVPIVWSTFAEPTVHGMPASIHSLEPADDVEGMHGSFYAAIQTKELAPLLTSVARPLLKVGGIHLGRVRLDVTADGSDGIRAAAYAGLRWKIFPASARATARIQLTPDAVITIRDLTVGSRNLLVKFALLVARRQVREVIGQTIDLNAQLAEDGTSARIYDLRVEAGEQLTVSARFG